MIDDDRCRRVMKQFRKRRRQRGGLTATGFREADVGRLEILQSQNALRRTRMRQSTSPIKTSENDDDASSFEYEKRMFPKSSVEANRRYRHHQNQRYKRQKHITWGENIVRRRAFSGSNRKKGLGNSTSSSTSQPELIHRKPETFSFNCYSSCTFLDSYDRVLAVDNKGSLDLIRLADIRSQNSIQGGAKVSQSHQKLVADFELGAELNQQSFSTARVQALSGGRTVAFGLADDSLCLLHLDGRSNSYVYGGKNRGEALLPVSLATGTLNSSLLPQFTASRTTYPRRTHYRDRRNPKLSINELCRSRMNEYIASRSNHLQYNGYASGHDNPDVSELHAIDYTSARERISSPVRFIPGLRPPHDARWDILEVRPSYSSANSLLYVAHVDSDYDAFWTQVLDGRVRASSVPTTPNKTSYRYNATTILIDGTTRDRPGKVEEHVTACTMVTDVCMATAHISCGNYGSTPASEFFDRGLPYAGYSGMSSCIKLWDLRMVRKEKEAVGDTPIPADTIVFPGPPSFQDADFAVLEPSATIHTQLTSTDGLLAFSEPVYASDSCADSREQSKPSFACGDHVITNLSTARGPFDGSNNIGSARGGSMIVTTQSRTKSSRVEHAKLDLSGSIKMTRRIPQTNFSSGCQPVYAIDSSHKYLATCSDVRNGSITSNNEGVFGVRLPKASTRLTLYNLNEEPSSNQSTQSSVAPWRYREQREDPSSWTFQTEAALADRYGVKTELSCMAMNANGTALLGGTTDGDLFLWRGI